MSIEPFSIDIPQTEVDDLGARLANTRWPATPGADDWSRGVPASYLKELTAYWAEGYDWRAAEAALNEIPQYRTEIDGQRIHFFHQKSVEPDALPLILTHGWPGSPVEFQQVIGRLTDPVAHGGDAADAFHVVVPSLPGYGFSTPLGPAGFNLFGVAQMWAELTSRLGYDRYAAHGTDAGSGVTGMLTMIDPAHVVGAHLAGVTAAAPFAGPVAIEGLSESDRARAETFNRLGPRRLRRHAGLESHAHPADRRRNLGPGGSATNRNRSLRRRNCHQKLGRPTGSNDALGRIRRGRPLRCHGGARPPDRRPANLLQAPPLSCGLDDTPRGAHTRN